LAKLADRLKRFSERDRVREQADHQAMLIQKYCWDPRDSFYYTVDVQCKDERSKWLPSLPQGMPMSWQCIPLRIQTVSGFLPLWCGLPTQSQARDLIARNYSSDDRFRGIYGIRTLSNRESMYSLAPNSGNPSNCLGPLYIITNYIVWKGLTNYGFKKEADELADKTVSLLSSDLDANGSLNEYYDPDTGRALSHQGFVDWNMLVLEMI
jgi:putative isomerase